jgi:hypothetical protein
VDAASGTNSGTCGTVAQPCADIQQAVNNVPVGGAGEIRVAGGTYVYNAGIDPCGVGLETQAVVCIRNRQVTLRGGYHPSDWNTSSPGANPTSIDGQSTVRGIVVEELGQATSIELEGVTVRNGRATGTPAASQADFSKSSAFGGGMLVDVAAVTIRNVSFQDNEAIGADNTIERGGSGSGGGLALRGVPAGSSLQAVRLFGNTARGGEGTDRGGLAIGGAFFSFNTTISLDWILARTNLALAGDSTGDGRDGTVGELADAQGGALAFQSGSDATLSHAIVETNSALGGNAGGEAGGGFGGGIYAELADVVLQDLLVRDNQAVGGSGTTGGLGAGGGIMTGNTQTTVGRAEVIENWSRGGDGSSTAGAAGGGGGYFTRFLSNSDTHTIENSIFGGNLTAIGATGASPGGGGGGLWLQGTNATLRNVTIADNDLGSSVMGGPAMTLIQGGGNPATVTLDDGIVALHDQFAGKAAIRVKSSCTLTLDEGLFAGNSDDVETEAGGTTNGEGTMTSVGSADFRSPGAPAFDYRLSETSPAIDPVSDSTVLLDVDGETRDADPDFGGDEQSGLVFRDGFEFGSLDPWSGAV